MHIACGIFNYRSFILVNHLGSHQTAHGGNTQLSSFLSHLNYDHAVRPLVSILIYTTLLYPILCHSVLCCRGDGDVEEPRLGVKAVQVGGEEALSHGNAYAVS